MIRSALRPRRSSRSYSVLFDAWEEAARSIEVVHGNWRAFAEEIALRLSKQIHPIAQDLLVARALGHQAVARQIAAEIRKDLTTLSFSFGRLADPVQEEADKHAAEFVREIGEDTRTTLAAMIQRGVNEGLPPRQTAGLMRDSVGLTVSQANAVQNYRRLLETGSPEAQERALRDENYDVAPGGLANLTPEQIDARVDAYRRRYVMYRATNIARTETLQASNAGGMSAVQSAIRAGTISKTSRVLWKIAKDERTCPRCLSIVRLQPEGVKVGDLFKWREGKHSGEIAFAPLHSSCRCTNAYRIS